MASDPLADVIFEHLEKIDNFYTMPASVADALTAWLRSPEGRVVVARELGLWPTDGVNCCQASARNMDESYADWRRGHEAGRRETAVKIAEAIEAREFSYVEEGNVVAECAADIARSFITD